MALAGFLDLSVGWLGLSHASHPLLYVPRRLFASAVFTERSMPDTYFATSALETEDSVLARDRISLSDRLTERIVGVVSPGLAKPRDGWRDDIDRRER